MWKSELKILIWKKNEFQVSNIIAGASETNLFIKNGMSRRGFSGENKANRFCTLLVKNIFFFFTIKTFLGYCREEIMKSYSVYCYFIRSDLDKYLLIKLTSFQ